MKNSKLIIFVSLVSSMGLAFTQFLPHELQELILSKASIRTVLNYCSISKKAAENCENDVFWNHLVQRDYGIAESPSIDAPWKTLYSTLANQAGQHILSTSNEATCAITEKEGALCWGAEDRKIPLYWKEDPLYEEDLLILKNAKVISAGPSDTCVIDNRGKVLCWGDTYELAIPSSLTLKTIMTGADYACGVNKDDGKMICWQFMYARIYPLPDNLGKIRALATSSSTRTCALKEDWTARCFEFRTVYGQDDEEGDGVEEIPVPTDLGRIKVISNSNTHSCAVKADGTGRCWGADTHGQSSVPSNLGQITTISTGGEHTCAIQQGGIARCWGRNQNGQSTVPDDLGPVIGITAASRHTCAVKTDLSVKCWGSSSDGESDVPHELGRLRLPL